MTIFSAEKARLRSRMLPLIGTFACAWTAPSSDTSTQTYASSDLVIAAIVEPSLCSHRHGIRGATNFTTGRLAIPTKNVGPDALSLAAGSPTAPS